LVIFWKTAHQLYRYYRPAKVDHEIEEIDDDYSSEIATDEPTPVVAIYEQSFDEFEVEFEVEFAEEFADVFAAQARQEDQLKQDQLKEDQLEEEFEKLAPAAASAEATWPEVERRKAGRPWSNRPAVAVPVAIVEPDERTAADWAAYVPNVYSIDVTGWSAHGNKRWQDAHPDAWEDADRWLAEALSPASPAPLSRLTPLSPAAKERDSQVA
jgi:hypothetical protein